MDSMFGITAIAAASFMAGLGTGRSMQLKMEENEEELRPVNGHRHKNGEQILLPGEVITSPCSGEVSAFHEGSRSGVVIAAAQGLVHSPASGKIIRLYPMGNAFLLRTESGAEVFIRVGKTQDDLFSRYYMARIVQNEIVYKGKLLLEFDLEGLRAEGENTEVAVSVDTSECREIFVTAQGQIRVGQELFRISID